MNPSHRDGRSSWRCLIFGAACLLGLVLPSAAWPLARPDGLSASDWDSIRATYEAGRHAFQPVAEGWQARNPGQQWRTTFDRRGFEVQPQDGGWSWGLELKGYGFGEHPQPLGERLAATATGQRLTYPWDDNLREWYVNDTRGLEHGFTVQQRPPTGAAPGPLTFILAVRGTLRPQIAADAQGVAFQDASGGAVLSYTGLKVWDADGKTLPARFEAAGADRLRLVVDEHSARYPLTIDPLAQQAYIKASNTGVNDAFGTSVAVAGDTVVVGASEEDSNATGVNGNQANNSASAAGAAYVFVRGGATWTQQAYLKASNTGPNDRFGFSVALSGDTLVVGAPGEGSTATGVNGDQADNRAPEAGAVYVFTRSGSTWSQQAYLKASNTGELDEFGVSVAVAGNTLVVGAWSEDSNATGVNGDQADNSANSAGAAYVFTRSGATWSQQAYLKASNTGINDLFGRSVALSGDTLVVGAFQESSNATGVNGNQADNSAGVAGAAYVFTRSGGAWTQQAYLKASNTDAYDAFGASVALSGDTLVVGASGEDSNATGVNGNQANDSANGAGAAYVFVRGGGAWSQQAYLKASNTGALDGFGSSVAVAGNTVVVGAIGEDSNASGVNGNQADNSAGNAGAAYVFTRGGTTWSQQAYLKASNTGADDGFGRSVAVAGDRVVIGAPGEASNATGVNGNQADNSAGNAGAAYVFALVEIAVSGNNVNIADGDNTPDLADHTDFGTATVGGSSVVRTFTIQNTSTGTGYLTLGSITVGGGHAADFSLTAPPSSPVAPGGDTTFQVTFDPSATGPHSATLSIANNDADENPFNFSIQGNGAAIADLAITKTDGVTTVTPGTSVTYTIVASNAGPNTATGVTVSDPFPASLTGCSTTAVAAGGATGHDPGPTVGHLNDTGITLPPGGSVTYTATCMVDAGATDPLSNTATVSAATTDPNTDDNSATDTDSITPVVTRFTGPTATGTGNATATVTGGGNTCGFVPTPQFVAVASVPAPPPTGYTFPHGLFSFTLANCNSGETVTLTVTYPNPLPLGTQYWKFGPEPPPGDANPHWYVLPANITGNTASFSITDGGLGDDDLSANRTIVDQGGPGVPPSVGNGATGIPTLHEWALLLLSALFGGLLWRARRRLG